MPAAHEAQRICDDLKIGQGGAGGGPFVGQTGAFQQQAGVLWQESAIALLHSKCLVWPRP